MAALRRTARLASLLRHLMRDRRGAAAVFLAIALVPLMGGVGLAVDASLGYLLRARLMKSLDAAGLAAGRIALDDNAKDVARDYFDANFGTGGGAVVTDFTFELDSTKRFVTLTARANTPTYFMRVFGHNEMQVAALTKVERQTSGMELALILDNTGSMWGTNFNAMQNAALGLIDIIFGTKEEVDNLWVSLTPYVATVNVGKSRTGWLNSTDQVFTSPSLFGTEGWKGCVMAQAMPYDTGDTPPTVQKLSSYLYPQNKTDNYWPPIRSSSDYSNETATGPNLACPSPITPLTKSKSVIVTGLKAMKSWRRGGTTSNLGMVWGWRTISPRWRGLWGNADLPADYISSKKSGIQKVAVILTDGNNNFFDLVVKNGKGEIVPPSDSSPSDYTAYGRLNAPLPTGLAQTGIAAGVKILNNRMITTCKAMRDEGIQIYTIIYSDSPDLETKALFEQCASTPAMYYYAPSAAEIASVFKTIAGQLSNLRIVK